METPTKILVATLTAQRPDELAIIPLLPCRLTPLPA
jgi:hypothetical protein